MACPPTVGVTSTVRKPRHKIAELSRHLLHFAVGVSKGMENVIEYTPSAFEAFQAGMERILSGVDRAARVVVKDIKDRRELRAFVGRRLESNQSLLKNISLVIDIIEDVQNSPSVDQGGRFLAWVICGLILNVEQFYQTVKGDRYLTGQQFRQLKQDIQSFKEAAMVVEKMLAEKISFPIDEAEYLYAVAGKKLTTPLRIFFEDDDTGFHVSCFELPQLYGFGETKDEAREMLDREICSLYKDIKDDTHLSDEFVVVRNLLTQMFSNEQ